MLPTARADRPRAADRRAHRRPQPGHLGAPEPRLHGRPDLDGDAEHGADRPAARTTTSSSTPAAGRRRRTRSRGPGCTSFFANGGGYIGALANGANFLTAGGEVTGLTAANRGGDGRSGIVYWTNTGGAGSPVDRRLPGAGHGDHGPADLVHERPGDDVRGRPPAVRRTSSRRACGRSTACRRRRPARR